MQGRQRAKERRAQKYQAGGRVKTRVGSTSEMDPEPPPHATLGRGKAQTSGCTGLANHLGKLYPRNQGS